MGLDEDFGGHTRKEPNVLEAGHLLWRERDANGVIGRGRLSGVLLLLAREVRGYAGEHAYDLWCGPLVARHNAHDRLRSVADLIDVIGSDLGFYHEFVGTRNDLHDGLAVADHTAHRVYRKLMD